MQEAPEDLVSSTERLLYSIRNYTIMNNTTRPQNCSSLGPVQIANATVKNEPDDGLRLFLAFADAMDKWEVKFVGKSCPMAEFKICEFASFREHYSSTKNPLKLHF